MSRQTQQLYEFGQYQIEVEKRLLRCDGEAVPLLPKVFDTLLVLVQNHQRVMEKEELLQTIWPDSIVEEGNLTNNISILRKALGERPSEHRYIVTVPGRGYRFVAPVEEKWSEEDELVIAQHTRSRIVTEEAVGENVPSDQAQQLRQLGGRIAAAVVLFGLIFLAGYSWMRSRESVPAVSIAGRSVAVLPFRPIGLDEDHHYLGVGIADTLITRLGSTRQIFLRPTSAVLKYAELDSAPTTIGQELRVDAVLEGSIRQAGERVRVTVQLVDVQSGATMWGETFDETMTSLFALEDAISDQVANALQLQLTDEEQERLIRPVTQNAAVYEAYLRGRYFWNRRTPDNYPRALEHFQRAIDLDPDFAPAYSGLADTYIFGGSRQPPKDYIPQAKAAALRALELDDTLAEAHTSLALIKLRYERDWQGAEQELKRAIALNPNYAEAHHWHSHYLMATGRRNEAIAASERALIPNPIDVAMNFHLAWSYIVTGQHDQAIDQLQQTRQLSPDSPWGNHYLGLAYLAEEKYREAVAEMEQAVSRSGNNALFVAALGYAYAKAGQRNEAIKIVERLQKLAEQQYVSPVNLAVVYAGLEEKEQAFIWLERGDKERADLSGLSVELFFDSLRADARFSDLSFKADSAARDQ